MLKIILLACSFNLDSRARPNSSDANADTVKHLKRIFLREKHVLAALILAFLFLYYQWIRDWHRNFNYSVAQGFIKTF